MIKSSQKIKNLEAYLEAKRARTHCKNGHPFSGKNLLQGYRGQRRCRICADEFNSRRSYVDRKYVAKKTRVRDVLPAPEVVVQAMKVNVLVKKDNLTREEWLKLYGIKTKRPTVDYSKIDIPWC